MASAAVTSAAAVKASAATAVETSASVGAAETRLPARGKASGDSSMIKAAERTGMATGLDMRRRRSVLRSCESMLWGCKSMLLG